MGPTKAEGRGTGLGLSITHDVIGRHGTIAATSEPGHETRFTIELPSSPAAETRLMSRILIVDDDGETCRFMANCWNDRTVKSGRRSTWLRR